MDQKFGILNLVIGAWNLYKSLSSPLSLPIHDD